MIMWTREEALAWSVWHDLRMVELVAPKDGDDDNTETVERLLADQKEARRRPRYTYSRERRHPLWRHAEWRNMFGRLSDVEEREWRNMFNGGLLSDVEKQRGEEREWRNISGGDSLLFRERRTREEREEKRPRMARAAEFPEPVRLVADFKRAVEDGRLRPSEFGMFVAAEVQATFPSVDKSVIDSDLPQRAAASAESPASSKPRGAYQGQLSEWLASKELDFLQKVGAPGLAKKFKAVCEQRGDQPLLPVRPRSMVPFIENHIWHREKSSKGHK